MSVTNSSRATPGTNGTAAQYNGIRNDIMTGWVTPQYESGVNFLDESPAYSSVSGNIGVITVASDGRERYEVGDFVRFKQGGAYKYFKIVAVSATTISVSAAGVYALVNAAITDFYVSKFKNAVDLDVPAEILYTDTDGSTITFDILASKLHEVTITNNRTLAVSNVKKGDVFILTIIQDGTGGRTVTWFSTIQWPDAVVPTLSTGISKRDTFGFICTGTNTYQGFIIGQNLS